jgi:hypothetical protein
MASAEVRKSRRNRFNRHPVLHGYAAWDFLVAGNQPSDDTPPIAVLDAF